MIDLVTKQDVILKVEVEGLSQRSVATKLGISRNTVKKYIQEYRNAREKFTDLSVENFALTEAILEKPSYNTEKRAKRKLTEGMMDRLDFYIKQNVQKRTDGRRKQQMKIIDMHEALLEQGFDIGYTTVRNYVREKEKTRKEAFIRAIYEPGVVCEFDWGEVKLEIGGRLKNYQLAVFTMAYSNYRFAKLYHSQQAVCFQDAHVEFFRHLARVPVQVVYDNMRTVVKKFIGTERELSPITMSIAAFYGFQVRLCNPRKGNEKGHVERSVEVVRRKAFSLHDSFDSIEQANEHLQTKLNKLNQRTRSNKTPSILILEEQAVMTTPMGDFDASEIMNLKVDKYSTVTVKQNHYSVPDAYVGKTVRVKNGANSIRIFDNHALLAEHTRTWGVHEWRIDLYHYLTTLGYKKGALENSQGFKQAPKQIKFIYENYYTNNQKDFIALLHFIKEKNNLSEIITLIKALEKKPFFDFSTEKLIFLSQQKPEAPARPAGNQAIIDKSLENLSDYANLLNKEKEKQIS